MFDADLNASINIAKRWSEQMKKRKVELPVSFVFPSDGKYELNRQAMCHLAHCLMP